MLIVRCDTCGVQQEADGYHYDENPHGALTKHLRDEDGGRWDVVTVRISDTGRTIERDLCPKCAAAYRELLEQQELGRMGFFGLVAK